MINIIYTSKPHDGLFYYSYEHFVYLTELGYDCNFIIFPLENHTEQEYIDAINAKYRKYIEPKFNETYSGVNIMMGRSLLIFADDRAQEILKNPLILLYNNNHPEERQNSILEYFNPATVINLCDHEIYGKIGINYIKSIYFDIYKDVIQDIQFKYLFNGSNERYYKAAIDAGLDDCGILVYKKINKNDIKMPVNNLMGIFQTYVYTKNNFDPAPRIIQECKYFKKGLIYFRKDLDIPDGGSVYYKRFQDNFDFRLQKNIQPLIEVLKDYK